MCLLRVLVNLGSHSTHLLTREPIVLWNDFYNYAPSVPISLQDLDGLIYRQKKSSSPIWSRKISDAAFLTMTTQSVNPGGI